MKTKTFLVTLSLAFWASAAGAEDSPSVTRPITLAPLGDSRTAIISFDTAGLNRTTQSHLNWANALNGQKYPYTGNFGISGASSDKIVSTMLAPALATRPAFMPILMGVNDVRVPGFSAERTMSRIAEAADKALAQGTTPILCTDPGSEHYIAAQVAFINELNDLIVAYCGKTKGAVLFDLAALASTQRTPTIAFHPGWFYDGIHLQTLGAYKVGTAFAELMERFDVKAPPYPGLTGNLLANAGLAGSGGKIAQGTTGVLPDSFAGGRDNANCSPAFSLNTRADGSSEVVVTLAAEEPNTLGGMRVSQLLPLPEAIGSDGFQAGVQVDIDPGSVNLADVRAEVTLVFADGTFAVAYDFDGTQRRDTISTVAGGSGLSLTLQSPSSFVGAGKELKSVKFVLGARILGKGNATLRFRNPWCKRVPAVVSLSSQG